MSNKPVNSDVSQRFSADTTSYRKRIFFAFLIAPLAGPLGIYLGLIPLLPEIGHPAGLLGALPFVYLFAAPVVYFFSILLGGPLFWLLHTLRWITRNRLLAGWTLIGVLSFIALTGFSLPRSVGELPFLFPFALGGAAVGFLFWRILSSDPQDPWWIRHHRTLEEKASVLPRISKEEW